MTDRYSNFNTHIIDPEIDPGSSKEFLDLKGIDVIGKVPYDDRVSLFYRDSELNILHGEFKLGENEFYEGSAKVITYQYLKDAENITIKSSFYKPSEYFYFFYERESSIFVRSFKKKQGSLGEEILVRAKARISSINRFKENFFFVIEDLTNENLLEKININKNSELKILFLYENSISLYEKNEEQILHTQFFDVPFKDIAERLYSVENMVENDKSQLYISGTPYLEKDPNSINGMSCFDYEKIVTTMDHEQFTLILRITPNRGIQDGYDMFETDNITVKYYNNKLTIELSDGYTFDFLKDVIDPSNIDTFQNIILSVTKVGSKVCFNLGYSLDVYSESQFDFKTHVYENPLFQINEKLLLINHARKIDYLAIKNKPMDKRVMKDLLTCFSGNLFIDSRIIEGELTAFSIESSINEKIKLKDNSSVFIIPQDAEYVYQGEEIIANDRILVVEEGVNFDFGDDVRSAKIYIKSKGLVTNNKLDEAIVYIKKNGFYDGNHKKGLIYYEEGAVLRNTEKCSLIILEKIYFDDVNVAISQRPDTYLRAISGNNILTSTFNDMITGSEDINQSVNYSLDKNNEFTFYNNEKFFNKGINLSINEKEYETTVNNISGQCTQDLIPVNRFIRLDDTTLLDTERGIIWSPKPIYVTQLKLKESKTLDGEDILTQSIINRYASAKFEVANTFIYGTNDWRIPTEEEIVSILKFLSSVDDNEVNVNGIMIDEDFVQTGAFQDCVDEVIPHEDLSSFINKIISSDVFDVTDYNNLNVSEKGKIKNDNIWVEGGKRVSISKKTIVEDDKFRGCPSTLMFMVRRITPEYGVYARYSDGYTQLLPKIAGETFSIDREGDVVFEKSHHDLEIQKYNVSFKKTITYHNEEQIKYFGHEHTNSNNRYTRGIEALIRKNSKKSETKGTVFPIKLLEKFNIHKYLFQNPESNLRVCENLKQRDDMVPFIIEYDNLIKDILIWSTLDRFGDKIGFQYDLSKEEFFGNPFEDYNVVSKRTYSQKEYFSAFHFTKIIENNERLIEEITLEDNGEIMLIGKTRNNAYARQINSIDFFGMPNRFKSNSIRVEVDVIDGNDSQSYINNYEKIRDFITQVVNSWKPANVVLDGIIEKETLIMAKLLQDEYVQVLVGLTPLDNFNAYYNRTFDTREVSLKSSSDVSSDKINWIGIPQLNQPFVKSGITKVINERKNLKVNFETPYSNANYRVFVFSPYDAKFYTTQKDRDGFIIESSSLVREEVSWISLSTSEVINGSIKWRKGLPNGDLIVNHFDRISEITVNSNVYNLTFTDLGYEPMDSDNYSVILSTNTNVNVWIDGKTPNSFTIRRSFSGEDIEIDYLVVKGNSKWWEGITS